MDVLFFPSKQQPTLVFFEFFIIFFNDAGEHIENVNAVLKPFYESVVTLNKKPLIFDRNHD